MEDIFYLLDRTFVLIIKLVSNMSILALPPRHTTTRDGGNVVFAWSKKRPVVLTIVALARPCPRDIPVVLTIKKTRILSRALYIKCLAKFVIQQRDSLLPQGLRGPQYN